MFNLKPIPSAEMPADCYGTDFCDEMLVDISKYSHGKILCEPKYFLNNIPGSVNYCLVRESAADRLLSAVSMLPDGLTIKIYDSWRPITVQTAIYDKYYEEVSAKHSGLPKEKLREITTHFVSFPSRDPMHPPVHNTGGAVDLTLVHRETGTELNMGTDFDDFSSQACTDYFEKGGNVTVRDNRRLLYNTMIHAGFTNLPSEWWHYDYGTAFWSYYTGKPAKYKGVSKEQGI